MLFIESCAHSMSRTMLPSIFYLTRSTTRFYILAFHFCKLSPALQQNTVFRITNRAPLSASTTAMRLWRTSRALKTRWRPRRLIGRGTSRRHSTYQLFLSLLSLARYPIASDGGLSCFSVRWEFLQQPLSPGRSWSSTFLCTPSFSRVSLEPHTASKFCLSDPDWLCSEVFLPPCCSILAS